MADELFEDVKAMQAVEKSVELYGGHDTGPVAAMERGTRERPDGTVERYERVEFQPQRH